jgi:hypothetical protein
VIDKRIDVAAQYALMRMFKGDPTERVDASDILSAVKSGALGGIYQEDQKAPALRAQSLGTWWGTILPKPAGPVRVDGVCMLEPREKPPIIAMRRKAETNPAAYDLALQNAWATCGIPPSPVRPYQTSPGIPLPPGKTGRCALPMDAPTLSVGVIRGGKVVAGAGVKVTRAPGYTATAVTADHGAADFEVPEGGLYVVSVGGGSVKEGDFSSRIVEVLPKCLTFVSFDLAPAARAGTCWLAELGSRGCLTDELAAAKEGCIESHRTSLDSCKGDPGCESRAKFLFENCMEPVNVLLEGCREEVRDAAGCRK